MNGQTALTLTPLQRGIFETTVDGKPAVMVFRRRNRSEERLLSIATEFNPKQITAAHALAKTKHVGCWVATEVQLKGETKLAFAVPIEMWPKIRTGKADFPVGPEAQKLYEGDANVLKNFKVIETEPASAAPDKPKKVSARAVATKTPAPAVQQSNKEMVNSIARSVAHELGGNATIQLPPMTRSDLFNAIESAVNKVTRQIGFNA